MIAISSVRPHRSSEVYRKNQIMARASWETVFDRIVYFSPFEEELDGSKVEWMEPGDYPFIYKLAEFAARQKDISAIINADIVVGPELKDVIRGMAKSYLQALTSRRYDLESGVLNQNDKGRDIFILKPRAWQMVAQEIPRSCRIGHNEWDSWMIGFCRMKFKKQFGEFTQVKCIFHPRHEERIRPYGDTIDITSPYKAYWDGTPDTQIIKSK